MLQHKILIYLTWAASDYISESTLFTLHHYPEVSPNVLIACASRVAGALLLLVSNVITGATTWATGIAISSTTSGFAWVVGSTALVGRGGRAELGRIRCHRHFCHIWGCQVYRCHHCRWGVRVMNASSQRWIGSQAPLLLLPSSLWPSAPLWPGAWSHFCHMPFQYCVF